MIDQDAAGKGTAGIGNHPCGEFRIEPDRLIIHQLAQITVLSAQTLCCHIPGAQAFIFQTQTLIFLMQEQQFLTCGNGVLNTGNGMGNGGQNRRRCINDSHFHRIGQLRLDLIGNNQPQTEEQQTGRNPFQAGGRARYGDDTGCWTGRFVVHVVK